jgi:hypothetical protein
VAFAASGFYSLLCCYCSVSISYSLYKFIKFFSPFHVHSTSTKLINVQKFIHSLSKFSNQSLITSPIYSSSSLNVLIFDWQTFSSVQSQGQEAGSNHRVRWGLWRPFCWSSTPNMLATKAVISIDWKVNTYSEMADIAYTECYITTIITPFQNGMII